MSDRTRGKRLVAALYVVPVAVVALTVVVTSLGWVQTTFPGFFVMANRVVPSIGRSHWSVASAADRMYQHQVLALDGVPVTSADEVYARVRATPGETHTYEVRAAGRTTTQVLSSMRFTGGDWIALFGALLLNGLIFTGVGVLVWMLGPPTPTTTGTMAVMVNLGLFFLTAMDLYGPARFFRLHVVTEALFAPTLFHLALVFPLVRLGRWRRSVLAAAYALAATWALVYEWWLYDPDAYSRIHNLCMLGVGIVGVGLILSGVQAYFTSTSLLVRKRLGVVAVGLLTGFAVPAWLLTASALIGGEAPINVAAFMAFLFPLSLAYAVLKHDLFEIDALLRRAISYLVLTGAVAALYAGVVVVVGAALQSANAAQSAVVPLLFGILMVFGLIPLRDRIQRIVDRIYHRTNHDAQRTLERASGALVATLDLDDISTLTIEVVCQSLLVRDASLWLAVPDGGFALAHASGAGSNLRGPLEASHPLVGQLRATPRAISTYERDGERALTWDERRAERALRDLGAELVLPLGTGDPIGFLALGPKESGRMFTLDDVNFLATFANQVAVAVLNARSYRQVEELNVSLEHKVTKRTSELANANDELATLLQDRERAYHELEQSQESLVRAEKMATVGRLTAGIAHEVNTPLGATLNSLKTLDELIAEYGRSIGDATVTVDDHRQIAGDLAMIAGNLTAWTNKAAGYIRSVKAHTRNLDRTEECAFNLSELITDTRHLLDHQLRQASCTLSIACPEELTLFGDAGKLGQVLTNLLTNAVDAYEGCGTAEGAIRLRVGEAADAVTITVEDDGAGIAPEHQERIFEELFTTKPSGRGTGLGLPISRDIVAKCFGGRLEMTSELGRGSRFAIVLPRDASARRATGKAA